MRALPLLVLAAVLSGCQPRAVPGELPRARPAVPLPDGAEAMSLFGQPLAPVVTAGAARERDERLYAAARAAWARDSTDADSISWLGRRAAYLGRYREAIEVFSRGLRLHPRDARLWRHRGHRWITVREFAQAEYDLARGAELTRGRPDEVEPDGQPNARGIPTSTLQFNLWYHLGLARFLQSDYEGAREAYARCLAVSTNPDARVATSHWYWMTLRRLGRARDAAALLAPITPAMDVIENGVYHRLLLLYKGVLPLDSLLPAGGAAATLNDASTAFGVSNWLRVEGRAAEADVVLRRILSGGQWASFGFVAAEADAARLGLTP
jgi:tetratricopeptide (TPR) repeat protein